MTTILQITSSLRGSAARSSQLADELSTRLSQRHADVRILRRDVASQPIPVLDAEVLGALGATERTPRQAQLAAQYDALVAELQAADVIVIAAPMYNFAVPVQLKTYFDAITRAGITFRYTAEGPEGLVRGKKVFVVLARGGRHKHGASDAQTPFLRQILGFLGMTDVEFVYAEGLDMGPEALAQGLAEARASIAQLTSDLTSIQQPPVAA